MMADTDEKINEYIIGGLIQCVVSYRDQCAYKHTNITENIHRESYLSEKSVRYFFDCVCKWRVHVWPPCS